VLDTRNKYVYCRKCDLANFQSVRDFVQSFSKLENKCDVLVNNAGVMEPKPRQLTSDGLELQLQTNHTGHLLLTDLLRDHLGAAGGGRVVYLVNLDYRLLVPQCSSTSLISQLRQEGEDKFC
jgi:retinol dehydrogenase-13